MKKGNMLGNGVGATWAGLVNTDFKIQTCLSWIFPKYEEVIPIWGGNNQNTGSFLVGELVLGSLESYHCPAPAFLGDDEALPRCFIALGRSLQEPWILLPHHSSTFRAPVPASHSTFLTETLFPWLFRDTSGFSSPRFYFEHALGSYFYFPRVSRFLYGHNFY